MHLAFSSIDEQRQLADFLRARDRVAATTALSAMLRDKGAAYCLRAAAGKVEDAGAYSEEDTFTYGIPVGPVSLLTIAPKIAGYHKKALAEYDALLAEAKRSPHPAVAGAAWAEVDADIAAIAANRISWPSRAQLHDTLYALSKGPMTRIDGTPDVRFCNGVKVHGVTAEYMQTLGLATGAVLKDGHAGSVLTARGAAFLERLTMTEGPCGWEKAENARLAPAGFDA